MNPFVHLEIILGKLDLVDSPSAGSQSGGVDSALARPADASDPSSFH